MVTKYDVSFNQVQINFLVSHRSPYAVVSYAAYCISFCTKGYSGNDHKKSATHWFRKGITGECMVKQIKK
jgi:hypothetical protein